MRPFVLPILCTFVAMLLMSCSSQPPAEQQQQPSLNGPSAVSEAQDAGGAVEKAPAPPKDARFTILCRTFGGTGHVFQARQFKSELMSKSGMKEWYIISSDGESTLYYGYYSAIDANTRDGGRARKDRARIASMEDALMNRLFSTALIVPLAGTDPEAPPEWNLLNAKGFWSLQVAAFKDSPERKQAAVDSVREARKQGVEAYFYHGPTVSSVCVGAWPREAVREQDANVENTARGMTDDRPLLVLPRALPNAVGEVRSPSGERLQTVALRFEPVDPNMIATMVKYPNHLLNGAEVSRKQRDAKTGRMIEKRDPSFVIRIPQKQVEDGVDNASDWRVAPPPRQTPGSGELNTIGG